VLNVNLSPFITTTLHPVENRGDQLPRARILLADDHAAILDHVSDMLKDDYEVIGTVADGVAVCSEVKKLRPDVVVLDISMGPCSGIEIARQLQEQGYGGEIIFLTVHEDPDFVRAAIGAGGRGYVIKSSMSIDLKPAVEAALLHRVFVSTLKQD
jgi:DNA-binding NarL/FixJ family response regulator